MSDHTFDHDGVCVDCGKAKFMIVNNQVPPECGWPGCDDPDPYDRSGIRTIPHTPLTADDKRRLAAGDLPEWVHEPG